MRCAGPHRGLRTAPGRLLWLASWGTIRLGLESLCRRRQQRVGVPGCLDGGGARSRACSGRYQISASRSPSGTAASVDDVVMLVFGSGGSC